MPVAAATSTAAVNAPAASPSGTAGAGADAGAAPGPAGFASLIALLQQDSVSNPNSAPNSANAQAVASASPAGPVGSAATPQANAPASAAANDATAQAAQAAASMVGAAAGLPAPADPQKPDAKGAGQKNDGQKSGETDDTDAPSSQAGADTTGLAASLLAAPLLPAQAVTLPGTKTGAKTEDVLSAPAAKTPRMPDPVSSAPAGAGAAAKPDAGAAFGDALAQASGGQVSGAQASGAAASAPESPNKTGAPKTGNLQNAKPAVAASLASAVSATPVPAGGGFSVQATPDSVPAPYTAQAVPASDPSAGQGAAAQTPASVMSQTAVQTLSALSMQISKRLDDGNTKFTVELHPADLGRVDVALTIDRDGKVNAHLNFDTPITAAAFSVHQSELRQQLTQAGLNVDGGSLTFSSRQDGQSSFGQGQFMNQQQNPHQGQPQSNPSGAGEAARALAAAGQANDAADLGLSNLTGQGASLVLNLIV